MFRRASLAVLCFLLSAGSHAEPLLERQTSPGMTEAASAVSTRCTIDETGQLATYYRLGADLGSSRVQQLQLTLPALRTYIRQASRGTFSEELVGVDGETRIYRAWRHADDGSYAEVILYEDNGGTGQKRVNQDVSAHALKNFIDLNCDGELRF